MSDSGPDETYQEIVAKLDLPGWVVVERRADLLRAVWSSPRPATGVARMELWIGPDVGFVSSPTPAG